MIVKLNRFPRGTLFFTDSFWNISNTKTAVDGVLVGYRVLIPVLSFPLNWAIILTIRLSLIPKTFAVVPVTAGLG